MHLDSAIQVGMRDIDAWCCYGSINEVSRPWAKFQILILQSKPVLITRVESAVTANTRPVRAPIRSLRSLPLVLSHI